MNKYNKEYIWSFILLDNKIWIIYAATRVIIISIIRKTCCNKRVIDDNDCNELYRRYWMEISFGWGNWFIKVFAYEWNSLYNERLIMLTHSYLLRYKEIDDDLRV